MVKLNAIRILQHGLPSILACKPTIFVQHIKCKCTTYQIQAHGTANTLRESLGDYVSEE